MVFGCRQLSQLETISETAQGGNKMSEWAIFGFGVFTSVLLGIGLFYTYLEFRQYDKEIRKTSFEPKVIKTERFRKSA